ncbi:putative NAD(P)-binding domain-containing protein [Abeliophyllum distichum]|uniref:NAD(P)-binding domain-containing protein n=1 Tax=Abeliophyllum distichum TaxID=126358 RepID=A0ABD1VDN4_9LAMI
MKTRFAVVGNCHLSSTSFSTINIDKIWSLVPPEVRAQAEKSNDSAPVIDVTQFGCEMFESNFTTYFAPDFMASGHDHYVHRHTNGLCIIGLAPYHVALKDEGSILEVVQETIDPNAKIEFRPNTEDDPHKRKPDISKAKELLGWEPKVPLRKGLPMMVTDFSQRIFGDHKERGSTAS